MLRATNRWTSTPTLSERLAGLFRPEARLLLAGGVIVLGGLACGYAAWRRRNRAQLLLEEETHNREMLVERDDLDPIDEALDESFPASDPPSFNARGTSNARRKGVSQAKS